MKQSIQMRELTIGEGRAKICVSLVCSSETELEQEAKKAVLSGADCVEWRADFFSGCREIESIRSMLRVLRAAVGELPMIFTLRTKEQGGEAELSSEQYEYICTEAAASGQIDAVDIEYPRRNVFGKGSEFWKRAFERNVRAILSMHFWERMPERDEWFELLNVMQESPADLIKVAVMPRNEEDVVHLSSWATVFRQAGNRKPMIVIAMSEMGKISRIEPQRFGSAMTFAYVDKPSAPGQIEIGELKTLLSIHDTSLMV